MPYIKAAYRALFDTVLKTLINIVIQHSEPGNISGNLNYIYSEMLESIRVLKGRDGQWTYESIKDVVGTLECTKLEFYRRAGAEREDGAIAENGDISIYKKGS